MIEVDGLNKQFGEIKALKNVTFSVPKGQIVGFLGANGAGKTTTMDILCGCAGADSGTVKIGGFDIFKEPIEAKKLLGYLPDEPPLHDDLKVNEFLPYVAKLKLVPKEQVNKSVERVIEQLSLGDVKNRLIGNLSKGYRQRVALAQALVNNPQVLILDEPTEGLDPNQILQIRNLIKDLAGDHTILLSSHILSEVENTCDHIIIINKGEIVKRGTYEDIVRQKDAKAIYRMSVAKNASSLLSTINSISGVVATQVDGHSLELSLDDEDKILDQVVKKTVESGFGLRSLTQQSQTLEDVFYQLTR